MVVSPDRQDTLWQAFQLRSQDHLVTRYTPQLTEPPGSPFDNNKICFMNTRRLEKTPLQTPGNTESPRSKKSKQRWAREQLCKQAQTMWVLGVWSMAVAVCSAHQPITLMRGAFITHYNVRLMNSVKWLPLISIQWPLQTAMIGHASYLSPLIITSFSTNWVTQSANLPVHTQ